MQERPERLHPFWDLIKSDGGFIQGCLKELHPFFALIKSDGGCHSSSEQEIKKGACRKSAYQNLHALMRQPLIPFYGTMNAEFYTIFPATAHFAAVMGEAR